MRMPRASKPDPALVERVERALLDAENFDPERLRDVLAPAPSLHTPPHNLIGGDHLGQEQAIRFLRDMRELTRESLHVEEVGRAKVTGDTAIVTLRATATRGSRKLDTNALVRVRFEEGRVSEMWLEPANDATWNAFWSP